MKKVYISTHNGSFSDLDSVAFGSKQFSFLYEKNYPRADYYVDSKVIILISFFDPNNGLLIFISFSVLWLRLASIPLVGRGGREEGNLSIGKAFLSYIW